MFCSVPQSLSLAFIRKVGVWLLAKLTLVRLDFPFAFSDSFNSDFKFSYVTTIAFDFITISINTLVNFSTDVRSLPQKLIFTRNQINVGTMSSYTGLGNLIFIWSKGVSLIANCYKMKPNNILHIYIVREPRMHVSKP